MKWGRMQTIRMFVLVLLLPLLCGVSPHAQDSGGNRVVLSDPNANLCQPSARKLMFAVPAEWVLDAATTKQLGLCAVIVPKGKTLQNSDRMISVIFQRRNESRPEFTSFGAYVDASLRFALSHAPGTQQHDWKPASLADVSLEYRSTLIVGGPQGPSPCLYLWINSGDGYYTVQVSAAERNTLEDALYREFFASLKLQ